MLATDLISLNDERMRLHFHDGQRDAWDSARRFIAVLAGTQGGKTSFGPHWLYREIQRRGAGDYMVVTPTFPLLDLKALPTFLHLFSTLLQLGRFVASPSRRFEFSRDGSLRTFGKKWDGLTKTRVIFGYAADPESLESATAKAAWLDEAGQKKFRLGSWEAILRRLSLYQGRALITTTLYSLGWLKEKLFDPFQKGDSTIDVISFPSTLNPLFSQEEYARAERDLPRWKFDLFYRAKFARPAGLIYDAFDPAIHKEAPFPIPNEWTRYVGLDFGGVNTAAALFAEDPQSKVLHLYHTYLAGSRTAKEHVKEILKHTRGVPVCYGGSHSEDQWRSEFATSGMPVRESPIVDVEVGIARVYATIKGNGLRVFETCSDWIEEAQTYARELTEVGEPTEKIEDKADYHLLDATRYLLSAIRGGGVPGKTAIIRAVDPLLAIDKAGW